MTDEDADNVKKLMAMVRAAKADRRAALKTVLADLNPREQELLKNVLQNHPRLSVADALRGLRAGGM